MSVVTQEQMQSTIVKNVINEYIRRNQMFTVYQIWKDASTLNGSTLNYDSVRTYVENYMNLILHWGRIVGHHLTKLDNRVGQSGSPPQIYHPLGDNVFNYDPSFRLYGSTKSSAKPVVSKNVQPVSVVNVNVTEKQRKSGPSGLFRFNVWLDGKLVSCNLRQVRGAGGKFVKNNDYEGYGVLDDGSSVVVKQDNEGKLYAIKGV